MLGGAFVSCRELLLTSILFGTTNSSSFLKFQEETLDVVKSECVNGRAYEEMDYLELVWCQCIGCSNFVDEL